MTSAGWMEYNAGVAAGLVCLDTQAPDMFSRLIDGLAPPDSLLGQTSVEMAKLLNHPQEFWKEVMSLERFPVTLDHSRTR